MNAKGLTKWNAAGYGAHHTPGSWARKKPTRADSRRRGRSRSGPESTFEQCDNTPTAQPGQNRLESKEAAPQQERLQGRIRAVQGAAPAQFARPLGSGKSVRKMTVETGPQATKPHFHSSAPCENPGTYCRIGFSYKSLRQGPPRAPSSRAREIKDIKSRTPPL